MRENDGLVYWVDQIIDFHGAITALYRIDSTYRLIEERLTLHPKRRDWSTVLPRIVTYLLGDTPGPRAATRQTR